ncbi:hypothetical protein LP420_11445 [Massilia sp. B-10]|nr:hypothetical protein LP420_11445 [Massilia sp. B-10]
MRLPTGGKVAFLGQDLPFKGRHDADGLPAAFRDLGIGHVPEDRLRDGVIKDFSVMQNTVFGYQDRVKNRWGLLDFKAIAALLRDLLRVFDVRPANPDLRIGLLSGGNQQKVVIAREVSAKPKLMLVGQPTRGRHRHHRIDPHPAAAHARRGRGHFAGVGGTGRSAGAGRPHHRHVRWPHHR